MKNIINKLFVLFLLIGLAGCESDPLLYDVVNGQTLAQFSSSSGSLATPAGGASTTVDVLVSTVSSADREIAISIDASSTATADQYTISNLVIPANSYIGTITITSNFEALPEEGNSNLVLKLGDIGNSATVVEKGTFNLQFFRKCEVKMEDLVGTWSGSGSWGDTSFEYTTEVVTTIDENGDLFINGLAFQWFTGWWGEIIVTNDPVKLNVNEETGALTIDEQFYLTSTYLGDPQLPYNLKGTGMVLNACNKTIQIFPVFVQGGSAIDGTAWGPVFSETITLD